MLECVVNVSEGTDQAVLVVLAEAARPCVLDVHSDGDHGRTVFTLAGEGPVLEDAVRALVEEGVRRIDLRAHRGVHPRLGAVDVVPFVALDGSSPEGVPARDARDRLAAWAGETLGVPCFLYGPERSLPEVRREAFRTLLPDTGPSVPHPTAGAMCVGARPVLIAYNLWLRPGISGDEARRVARGVRGPAVRALGLDVGGHAQVSLNLVDPEAAGPAEAYDAVAACAPIDHAELVGLLPASVLDRIAPSRWPELGLAPDRTIEARLASTAREARGARGARGATRPTPPSRAGARPTAGGGDAAAPAR